MINLLVAFLNLYTLHELSKSKELYYDTQSGIRLYQALYWINWVLGAANMYCFIGELWPTS